MTVNFSNAHELAAAVLFIIQVGSAIAVAAIVTPRLAGTDWLDRGLVGTLILLGQGVGVPLLLGMLDLLYLPAVVVVHLLLLAGALLWHRRVRTGTEGAPRRERRAWHLVESSALGACVGYFSLGGYYALRGRRSLDFDTKEYHVNNLASWLQRHNIWHLPYAGPGSITATHPGNGELFGLWLALPTHRDELIYAMPLCFAVLALLASAVIARELSNDAKHSVAFGALAALSGLTVPVIFLTQVDSLETDVQIAACLLAAVALLLLARRKQTTPLVVLAGAALGLGLGGKYTALVPGALIALGAVALLRGRRVWWWLVPGVVLFAGPWFLKNAIQAGNPLFPEGFGVLPKAHTPLVVLHTTMLQQITNGQWHILRQSARLVRGFVGPVLALIAVGIVAAIRLGRDRVAVLVMLGITLGAVFGWLEIPYTGGGPTGIQAIIASTLRYSLPALLFGLSLVAGLIPARVGALAAAAVIGWNFWKIHALGGGPRPDLAVHSGALAGAAFLGAMTVLAVMLITASPAGPTQTRPTLSPGRLLPGLMVGTALSIGLAFIAIHRIDQRRPQTKLEQTLLKFGRRTPAVVLGVGDLRAVLGPTLDRRLVGVSRGGRAHEIPFTDDNQMRRLVLGDRQAPPEPPRLANELNAAIAATHVNLLVAGNWSAMGFPIGWNPEPDWCFITNTADGAVYATAASLHLAQCPAAGPGPVVGTTAPVAGG